MDHELLAVENLIRNDQLDDAEKKLKNLSGNGNTKGDVEYLRGFVCERHSDFETALDHYQAAIDADPHARRAMFRMAKLLNQRGDDDEAARIYEKCISAPPAPVKALINLAILYEDQGRYEQSRRILDRVVKEHPNHSRARAFLGDVENSITMYHDDDTDKVRHQRNAMMDTPVSEFELSVRARNCLKQMNINTIGDLLRTSELQLLAFKNFGETSLGEIKRMLSSRGLRLGQLVEQAPVAAPSAPAPPPPPVGANPALLNRPVAEMELSVRSRKCLQRLGVNSIGELIQRSEPELLSIKNFGQTSLLEIKRRLTEMGLSLAVPNR